MRHSEGTWASLDWICQNCAKLRTPEVFQPSVRGENGWKQGGKVADALIYVASQIGNKKGNKTNW